MFFFELGTRKLKGRLTLGKGLLAIGRGLLKVEEGLGCDIGTQAFLEMHDIRRGLVRLNFLDCFRVVLDLTFVSNVLVFL
jgi:hypothetical protein